MNRFREITDRLTAKDKKKLSVTLYLLPVVGLIMGVVFYFMFRHLKPSLSDPGTYIFGGISLFIIIIFIFIVYSYATDYLNGVKNIITGVVTDKVTEWPRRGSKNNRPRHFFYFGDKKLYVENGAMFDKVDTNDLVEYHYAPKSLLSLELSILKKNTEVAEIINPATTQDPLSEITDPDFADPAHFREIDLSAEDLVILKKYKYKGLLLKIFVILFFFYFFSFGVAFGWYWIYAIPTIIGLILGNQILKRFRTYQKDVQYGFKIPEKAVISNKYRTSRRKKGQTLYLKINGTNVAVDEEIYNKAIPGKEMILYKGKYSGYPINLT